MEQKLSIVLLNGFLEYRKIANTVSRNFKLFNVPLQWPRGHVQNNYLIKKHFPECPEVAWFVLK
jgi:hypothetical protein